MAERPICAACGGPHDAVKHLRKFGLYIADKKVNDARHDDAFNACVTEALAARDAEWRAAVEAVRSEHRLGSDLAANGAHAALRELLARMESQP